MRLLNPLQMNDWDIKSTIALTLLLLFLLWCFIIADFLGFHVPILRELVGFVYLTFVPGFLILRILRIHKLSSINTALYAVGLSIATLMFAGFFFNFFYVVIGVNDPISLWPLAAGLSALIVCLCFLCYARDRDFRATRLVPTSEFLSPTELGLCLLPFLAIFGTYSLNRFGNNSLQIVLLVLISIIPLIVIVKSTSRKVFPLIVFVISLSLLLHTILISATLWGTDINSELSLVNSVLLRSIWNPSIFGDANSMIGLTILVPIYSVMLNMNVEWVLKLVYPLLFSLVPLALYQIYERQTGARVAFLACFFFMSFFAFYTELPAAGRQEIAELFLVLLLLALVDRDLRSNQANVLLIFFGISLIVSHYGVSYIFILELIIAVLVLGVRSLRSHKSQNDRKITLGYVILYIIVAFAWYIFSSGGSVFQHGAQLGNSVISNIGDLSNPNIYQPVSEAVRQQAVFLASIEVYLHIVTFILITIGIFVVAFGQSRFKFAATYTALSYGGFAVAAAGVFLPYFALGLNTDRLIAITLVLLAPFCIVGACAVTNSFSKMARRARINFKEQTAMALIASFFAIYLLFNSALLYEVFDQPKAGRFALNSADASSVGLNEYDIYMASWVKDKRTSDKTYTDVRKNAAFGTRIGNVAGLSNYTLTDSTAQSYIVLVDANNIHEERLLVQTSTFTLDYQDLQPYEISLSRIYDSGGGWILKR